MTGKKLVLSVMAAIGLAGCFGTGGANPPQLWLALDGDELHAKLAAQQPRPY